MRKEGHVEDTVVGSTVGNGKPCPVNEHLDGKILKCNVVHNIIVATLKEGRIYSSEGLKSRCGKSCRERKRMRLGNTDVKISFGIFLFEFRKSRAYSHSRGYRHNVIVILCKVDKSVGKYRVIRAAV